MTDHIHLVHVSAKSCYLMISGNEPDLSVRRLDYQKEFLPTKDELFKYFRTVARAMFTKNCPKDIPQSSIDWMWQCGPFANDFMENFDYAKQTFPFGDVELSETGRRKANLHCEIRPILCFSSLGRQTYDQLADSLYAIPQEGQITFAIRPSGLVKILEKTPNRTWTDDYDRICRMTIEQFSKNNIRSIRAYPLNSSIISKGDYFLHNCANLRSQEIEDMKGEDQLTNAEYEMRKYAEFDFYNFDSRISQ